MNSLPLDWAGVASVACASLFNFASAAVINVPADQPTIQAGIDTAVNGDTVLVAPGTYSESLLIKNKSIVLQSTGGSGVTTIDASGLNVRALTLKSLQPPQANTFAVQGFTITGGAPLQDMAVLGGGVLISGGEVLMTDCTITKNTASGIKFGQGGGVAVTGGAVFSMSGCVVSDNTATSEEFHASGGGIDVTNGLHIKSPLLLVGCRIENNQVTGAITATGGGLAAVNVDSKLIGCDFSGNSVTAGNASGSGVAAVRSSVQMVDCIADANSASETDVPGGAVSSTDTMLKMLNCRVSRNTGVNSSGIVSENSGTLTNSLVLNHCTVADNTTIAEPPLEIGSVWFYASSGSLPSEIVNCIIHGNSGPQVLGPISVAHSCVQDGSEGEGNIDAEPLFVDPKNGDYRLATGSPCIDVGDLNLLPHDEFDLDGDGNLAEYIPFDLDGSRRVVNGFVDMGAYEWQHACISDVSPSSPGVAGNQVIDVDDLLAVINDWGACDGCVADIDADGDVNIDDLMAAIDSWGKCAKGD